MASNESEQVIGFFVFTLDWHLWRSRKEIIVSIGNDVNLWTYRPNNLTFNQSVATSVRLRKEKSVLR